jgi:hypothetical protein
MIHFELIFMYGASRTICWKNYFFWLSHLGTFAKNQLTMSMGLFLDSILFHSSKWLSLCEYHTDLIV